MNTDQMKELLSWKLNDKVELFLSYCNVVANTSGKLRYYLFEKLDLFLNETQNEHLKSKKQNYNASK